MAVAGSLIKLTVNRQDYKGDCWVNAEAIHWVRATAQGSIIYFSKEEFLHVAEDPDHISGLVRQASQG